MRKHKSGFVPINFKKAGKFAIAIGAIFIFIQIIYLLTGWPAGLNFLLPIGLILMVPGLYMVFIVREE